MNTIQSRIAMLVCLLALPVATFGAPVFSDDFSTDGSLNGMSADIGGTWSVVLNSLSASGGVVDTNASTDVGMAKASFTQALAEGEVMTLRFVTVESAGGFSFFGRAGISLYESGNEQVFMGGLGVFPVEWGIGGSAIGSSQAFSTSITAEPQTAVFEYTFDTGDWSFDVAGQTLKGTATAELAFNEVGIDSESNADIAVSSIDVTMTPEPATMSLLALGGVAMLRRRKH